MPVACILTRRGMPVLQCWPIDFKSAIMMRYDMMWADNKARSLAVLRHWYLNGYCTVLDCKGLRGLLGYWLTRDDLEWSRYTSANAMHWTEPSCLLLTTYAKCCSRGRDNRKLIGRKVQRRQHRQPANAWVIGGQTSKIVPYGTTRAYT